MSLTGVAADALAIGPPLASDIVIEIFNAADWRTILSMRQVSKLWYDLSKTWSIWATVVLRETLPKPDGPTLCYLEKPLEKYTSHALEALLKRWKTAERAFRGGGCETQQIKSFTVPVLRRHVSTLLPGGRWLIIFHDTRASYFDLDAEAPVARTLFPCQHLEPLPAQFHIGEICVQHGLTSDVKFTGLKIFMAVTFFDERISGWIVQVWKIEASDDDGITNSGLRATLRTAMNFRMDWNLGFAACKSLTTDLLVLAIQDGQGTNEGYISLVEWQNLVVDAGFDFKRATVPITRDERHCKLILVPCQPRLLVVTNTSVFLDDYLLVPHRRGEPTLSQALEDLHNRRRKLLLSNSNSIRQTFSRPYVFVRNPKAKNSHITIRVVALNDYHGRLLGMELEIPFADLEDNEANFSGRYAHLGALPTMGFTGNILLRHGCATAMYVGARDVPPSINTYDWILHWKVGQHNVQKLKALEELSDSDKFNHGQLVDMDEGTARFCGMTTVQTFTLMAALYAFVLMPLIPRAAIVSAVLPNPQFSVPSVVLIEGDTAHHLGSTVLPDFGFGLDVCSTMAKTRAR